MVAGKSLERMSVGSRPTTGRLPAHPSWRLALLGEEIRAALRPGVTQAEIQAAAGRLLSLAA